jgi:hypothetical protein
MATQVINLGNIDNTLTGGDDNYVITGANGNNTVTLGNGNDQFTLGNGNNTLTVGDGTDQIKAGSGNNSITSTGAGADTVTLTSGNNTVVLGDGPDAVLAGDGLNIVTTGNGNDTVKLGNGFDQVTTGNGNSTITVGNGVGDTIIVGTGGNTIALGTGAADTVHTGSGNNIVSVAAAAVNADSILGGLTSFNGTGNELMLTTTGIINAPGVGGFQIYQLANGGANNLILTNANFADLPGGTITVQDGNSGDTVNAAALSAAHSVIIDAGTGADVLIGGAGNDVFNVSDLAFSSINGGAGTNTLALTSSGLALDLGSFGNRIQNIEVINLAGTGNNTLAVSAADVLNVSVTSHTLKVEGNAGDTVTMLGTGWVAGTTSGGFTTYTNGLATLQLSTALTIAGGTIAPVFVNDNPLTVSVAGTGIISSSDLSVTDPDYTASQLTYTVTSGPSDGTLLKNSVATTQFTQADINSGLITYRENGTVATSDAISLVVTDPAGHSVSGSFPIVITAAADTTPPVFVNDNPLTVLVGGTGIISSSDLSVTDPDNTASQLTYTVTSGPSDGTLLKNSVATTQFTQADINSGLITYRENGTVATSDAISLVVRDPAGNLVTGSFPIVIAAAADTTPPVFVNDNPLTVSIAGTGMITAADLSVTDPDNTASQLTYTVTSGPSDGTLLKNLVATTQFTQADINSGLITYQENGTVATSDAISLVVRDPAGNSVTGSFPIVITAAADTTPPVFVNDNPLTVLVGGTGMITATNLSVTDPNYTASQLTYTVTSGPSDGTLLKNSVATTQFTQADVNNRLITYQENGTVATSDAISLVVTDPAGNSVTGSFPVAIESSTITGADVAAYYQAILRVAPPGGATGTYATTEAAQINAGTLTVGNYVSSLISIDQTMYTTLPALVTIDAFYGATPTSGLLTTVATATSGTPYETAAELHNFGYSDANVWTILATNWGADPTSTFYSQYDADATGTTSGYTTFIDSVYQQEFGFAPSAANLQNLLNDIPGLSALLSGDGHAATPIQIMSGLYGYLLYAGQTNAIGQYATSADAFLQAAANGTATYGPELTQEFPSGAGANPDVIAITGSNLLTDPGPGGHTIQFMPGTSDDTLMLHTGGVDQVSGFSPSTDVLDFSSVLSEASINLNGNVAALGNYVTIADQGANALVNFDPTGHGGGGTIAVLQGLGSTVTSLGALVTDNAIRIV